MVIITWTAATQTRSIITPQHHQLLSHCARGCRGYLTSLLVIIIQAATSGNGSGGWIGENLNTSHIDYFFFLLAGMQVNSCAHTLKIMWARLGSVADLRWWQGCAPVLFRSGFTLLVCWWR